MRLRLLRTTRALLALSSITAVSCHKVDQAKPAPPSGFVDRTFHSNALQRDVTYRARYANGLPSNAPIHVIYLLHGNGESYRTWSTASTVARDAPAEDVLVMPDGGSSYFMNSATVAADRYEDFLTTDLIADAERDLKEPVIRTAMGNSMGGFAAIVLAFKHPELYGSVIALSPPVDYPQRRFKLSRPSQSFAIRAIFGPAGSPARSANDPFELIKRLEPHQAPNLFIECGDEESLMAPIRRFDALLTKRHFQHRLRINHGGHNWQQWNSVLTSVFTKMQ